MRRLLLATVVLLLAACSAQPGSGPASPSSSPSPSVSAGPSSVVIPPMPGRAQIQADGFNIPWAVGGQRIERDGREIEYLGDWPTVHFSFQRLWDNRTAWLNLEPARNQWSFDHLDELVQKANDNGVNDVMLVLAGTPLWAASQTRSTDASWMGAGSASMPLNLEDWRTYVSTVATRYAGRITSYEIGNEPNLLTFWNGTPEQWAKYVTTAAEAIRAADPMALVLVSGGLVRNRADIARLATWLKPIANLAADGRVDAVAVHFYPKAESMPSVAILLTDIAVALRRCGWGDVSRWITEINVTRGVDLPAADQMAAVSDLTATAEKAGFQRLYWYAWTDLGPADLIQFQPGTAGEEAVEDLG